MDVDDLTSRAIRELERRGATRSQAVSRVLRMTKGEQLGLFGGGRQVGVKAHVRRTKTGTSQVKQHQRTAQQRKAAADKAARSKPKPVRRGLRPKEREALVDALMEQEGGPSSRSEARKMLGRQSPRAQREAYDQHVRVKAAVSKVQGGKLKAKADQLLQLVDKFGPMDAVPSLAQVLKEEGVQDWMADDIDDVIAHAQATVANNERQAEANKGAGDADPVEVVDPLDHNVHDGYRIDGSKVPMWSRKADAKKAVKALGWRVSDLTKVHTRFQGGWSIYAHGAGPDAQGGLVSASWARKRLRELGYTGPMGTMKSMEEAAQMGDPQARAMLDGDKPQKPKPYAADDAKMRDMRLQYADLYQRIEESWAGDRLKHLPDPHGSSLMLDYGKRDLEDLLRQVKEINADVAFSVQSMRKGTRLVLHVPTIRASGRLPLEKAWLGNVVEWVMDAATCRFRKADTGVGVLTVTGVSALPYHVIVKTAAEARSRAIEVVDALKQGRSPSRGVFRLDIA